MTLENRNETIDVFDLSIQQKVDNLFYSLNQEIEIISLSKLHHPQIPTLLPKSIDQLRLSNFSQSKTNFLLNALGSLVTFEELIYLLLDCDGPKSNFEEKPNVYRIFMTEFGQRKVYEIDDTIYVTKQKDKETAIEKTQGLFLNSNGNDIWANILEKFYANKFGLYSSIITGMSCEVIYNFVDGEYKIYKLAADKKDGIWNFLLTHYKKNITEEKDQEQNEYMNVNRNERQKIIMIQTYYPGHALDKDLLSKQSAFVKESSSKAKKERSDVMHKIILGKRNCNTYWDFLTNQSHIITDAKNVSVEKIVQEIPIQQNNKSKTLKETKKIPQQRKKEKSQTVIIQNEFKGKYLKLRYFDQDLSNLFLVENFREKWTQEHVKFIAPAQNEDGQYLWVNFDKLYEIYATISINTFKLLNLSREYNKSNLKLSLDGKHSCILVSFDIQKVEDKIVLGLHQKHKNFFNLIKTNYQYSNCRMILLKMKEKKDFTGSEFDDELIQKVFNDNSVTGVYNAKFDCSIDHQENCLQDYFLKGKLKKGMYIIAVEVFWENDYFKNINLTM